MMRSIILWVMLIMPIVVASNLYAAQSTITEADGYACMGEDKSRKQTEQVYINLQTDKNHIY